MPPQSLVYGRGCWEHNVACPGGPRGPGVDHGRQGQRLTVAGGQAQSSLQGHILQEKQSSSEKVSDQVALLLWGKSLCAFTSHLQNGDSTSLTPDQEL